MFGDVLITEHFFERNAADWCNLLKTLDVKFIFVAENDVMERLALHICCSKLRISCMVMPCIASYMILFISLFKLRRCDLM